MCITFVPSMTPLDSSIPPPVRWKYTARSHSRRPAMSVGPVTLGVSGCEWMTKATEKESRSVVLWLDRCCFSKPHSGSCQGAEASHALEPNIKGLRKVCTGHNWVRTLVTEIFYEADLPGSDPWTTTDRQHSALPRSASQRLHRQWPEPSKGIVNLNPLVSHHQNMGPYGASLRRRIEISSHFDCLSQLGTPNSLTHRLISMPSPSLSLSLILRMQSSSPSIPPFPHMPSSQSCRRA